MKTGIELFDFYTSKNDEYSSIVKMLPHSIGYDKTLLLLERLEKEGKHLTALYGPAVDVSMLEYVGEINDGALFIA